MSAKDIVCAEGELSYAAREIQDYAAFLIKSIKTYDRIIAGVQRSAIQDDLICARLSAIVNALDPYEKEITDASDKVSRLVKRYIEEVEDADNFIFPGDFASVIKSILSIWQ